MAPPSAATGFPTLAGSLPVLPGFPEAGMWETLRDHLVVMLHEQEDRNPAPSASILDTQSVKATEKLPSSL